MTAVLCPECGGWVQPTDVQKCEHCGRRACVACRLLEHDSGECALGEGEPGFEDEGGYDEVGES